MQKIIIQNQEAQLLPITSLLENLPEDSSFRQYFPKDDHKALALYFDGDAEFDHIDLDNPFNRLDADWSERYCRALDEKNTAETERLSNLYDEQVIRLIVVQGDLSVTRFIFNEETDGACSLIVLGSLHCPDIIVGGQEIYVQQDLVVNEIFWGDYNHGELIVKGNMTASMLIQTDYSVKIHGLKYIDTHLDEYDFDTSGIVLSDLINDEALTQFTGCLNGQLSRYGMHELLLKGLPLLKEQKKTALFSSYDVSLENLRQLSHFNIIGSTHFEYRVEDVLVTVTRAHTDEQGKSWKDSLRLEQDSHEIFICAEQVETEEKETFLKKLFAAPKTNFREQLAVIWKAPDEQWYYVDEGTPAAEKNLLKFFWPHALMAAERMEQLAPEEIALCKRETETEITVAAIEYYLNLPIVLKQYNDYYDSEKNGYWSDSVYFAFRQNNQEYTDRIQLVQSRPSQDLQYFPSLATEDDDSKGYQYDIQDDLKGNKNVQIRYLPHDGKGSYPLTPLDVDHYRKALGLWRYFIKHFPAHNARFEAGSWDESDPNPYIDDDDDLF